MRWSAVSDARSEHRVAPTVVVAGSIALVAAYPLMPVIGKDITFAGFAALVVIPVLFGYLRRAPGLTAQWLLLVAAMVVGAVANVVERVPFDMPSWHGTAVGTAKGIVNVILLAAAIGVVFHRGRNNLGSLIDAALVAVALGGLLWNVVVLPGTAAATLTPGAQVMLAVILMVLAGTLGALLQLLANDPGNRALALLFVALALKLVGYVTIAASAHWGPTLGMMAYLGGYVALGLAVLNPAIHRLAEPVPPRPDRLGPARLALLSAALLAVPIAVGLRELADQPVSGTFLIIAAALTVPLVMVRIGLLAAELHRSERTLRHLASHDPLTSVLNRREFTNLLETELAQRRDCALIFCDLNSFKQINDRYGHLVGDQLLMEVAQRLRACVRDDDLISRFGGDEFLLLLRAPTRDDLVRAETCIVDALAQPFQSSGGPVHITASIGAIVSDTDSRYTTVEQLVSHADAAMYARKRRTATPSPAVPQWTPAVADAN